jgi:hypothetical protein
VPYDVTFGSNVGPDGAGVYWPRLHGKAGEELRKLLLAVVLATPTFIAAPVAAQEASGDSGGIAGFITELSGTAALVEENPLEDSGSNKASVGITAETQILIQQGQDRAPAAPEDLAVGQLVEATFIGPVAESYPVQTTAGSITIVEDPNEPAVPPPSGGGVGVLPDTGGAALPPVILPAGGCLLAAMLRRSRRTSPGDRRPDGRTPG